MGTWEDFCDELKRAGAFIDRPQTPSHEIDRAEGYRYLTRLLRIGLDLTLEFADPRAPQLVPAQAKHFGDGGNTADCIYLHAVVDGRLRYRLRGQRGTAPLMEIGLYAGKVGLDPTSRRIDALREDDLVVDSQGCIDVGIGDVPGSTNTLHANASANYVFVRQYAHDWTDAHPASLTLEVVDSNPHERSPLTVAATARGLQRSARFVSDAAAAWASVIDNTRRGPANTFNAVPDNMDMTLPSGHRFAFGHFDLADNEALLIEFAPADVPYWGLTINNYWFEVVDYGEHGSHLNNRTVHYEPNGRVRAVISMRRPPTQRESSGVMHQVPDRSWEDRSYAEDEALHGGVQGSGGASCVRLEGP